MSSCHLVLQQISCSCFGVPDAQGSHGCRLVIIVSLPGEQGPLGHWLVIIAYEYHSLLFQSHVSRCHWVIDHLGLFLSTV